MSLAVFNFKRKKGFSTAEVILAMFVLATGLVAMMSLISKSLNYSLESREVIIATQLAQEGAELVRNVRDNDFADGNSGFSGWSDSEKHCIRDYNDTLAGLACDPNVGSATRYYLQYRNGFYEHFSSGISEKFSRYIYVNYDITRNDALVRSFVYWNGTTFLPPNGDPAGCNATNYCVFTELYLTSWK